MTPGKALQTAAAHPGEDLTQEARQSLALALDSHPYFALAASLLLPAEDDRSPEAEAARARVAVLTADKSALAALAAPAGENPALFYPPVPEPQPITTGNAIDTFLDTYGHTSPEEEALLEKLIFNPVPDYADVLAAEAAGSDGPLPPPLTPQDALIDAFLGKNSAPAAAPEPEPEPEPEPKTEPEPTTAQPDTTLSESLARIFISRGSYERALEVLTALAENTTAEANPFIEDQMRYLRRLIALKAK